MGIICLQMILYLIHKAWDSAQIDAGATGGGTAAAIAVVVSVANAVVAIDTV